nr:MAG TPA: hypothetical protein [Bacteriophage sp.]
MFIGVFTVLFCWYFTTIKNVSQIYIDCLERMFYNVMYRYFRFCGELKGKGVWLQWKKK